MRRGLIGFLQDLLRPPSKNGPRVTSRRGVAASDVDDVAYHFEYSPCLDGDPDPGEVVWTWVPYEEDPSQGKDRPVAIIGRRGDHLLGVPLTSKDKRNEQQVPVGTGPWDREGRPSFAKVDRVLDVVPSAVRREGSVLDRKRFDAVVAGVQRAHAQFRARGDGRNS
jgi:hypothetical protein